MRNILGLITLCAWLMACSYAAANTANPGDRAPVFAGYDIVSKHSVSLDDYHGQWVLVDFWASWCSSCCDELPELLNGTKPFRDAGRLALVSISCDDKSTLTNLRKLIRKHHIDYPVLYDGLGLQSIPAQEWHVDMFSSMYLINPQGVIVATGFHGHSIDKVLRFYLDTPRPLTGFRTSRTVREDGSILIRAEVSSANRQPVELKLMLWHQEWIWAEDDPSRRIIANNGQMEPDPLTATLHFTDTSEAIYEFVVRPHAQWHVVEYDLYCRVPDSQMIVLYNNPGIMLHVSGQPVIYMDAEERDGSFYAVNVINPK
jgi:peroxiredoxin